MHASTTHHFSDSHRRALAAALVVTGVVVMLLSLVLSGTAAAVPNGNNGTIKIDGLVLQGGPANEPHVDCEFALEFSGYDQGDLEARVTFALQAPTRRPSGSQVLLTDTLAIGQDPAGGANDLDASKVYRLDFTGVNAHPQQGYHVKVTIRADGSQGADTKHKVFWVQPCPAPSTSTTTTTATTATTATTVADTTPTTTAVLGGSTTTPEVGVEVLGEQLVRPQTTLPRTGTGTNRLLLLAGFALTLGGLLGLLSDPDGARRPSLRT
jgi:hypothetical protein